MRWRRPLRRYLDAAEVPDDDDREVEVGGGHADDKPAPLA
jgi:hypothetical protein